ncbi:MAG: tRNA 2-selenouridine(34) synthase MnmH, partial [Sulfurovum sp.]|nr:tRNA 2-selenouridine(34) synthase MnmH [Sulfurovum sp.]
RSEISQMLIAKEQKNIVRLRGGYKAFRNYLIDAIEDSPTHFKPLILGGRTGSGKTILLHKIQNAIDLEGLANHRGSSFGRKTTEQPTQINFENTLAYSLIQKLDLGFKTLIFEDEGAFIGRVYLPSNFANYLREAPLVILETPIEERIKITFDEYIVKGQESYKNTFQEGYLELWVQDIQYAMKRIKKRLGGLRYEHLCGIFDSAVGIQTASGSLDAYKELIAYLLTEYYDPMYDYQIKKNASRIVFRGSSTEIERYFNSIKDNS